MKPRGGNWKPGGRGLHSTTRLCYPGSATARIAKNVMAGFPLFVQAGREKKLCRPFPAPYKNQ